MSEYHTLGPGPEQKDTVGQGIIDGEQQRFGEPIPRQRVLADAASMEASNVAIDLGVTVIDGKWGLELISPADDASVAVCGTLPELESLMVACLKEIREADQGSQS